MANGNVDTTQTPKNILGQLVSQGLNPRQDNILKTILKRDKENAEEFLDSQQNSEEAKASLLKQFNIPNTEQEAVNQISDPNQSAQLIGDERNQITQNSQVPRAKLSKSNNPFSGFINAFLSKDSRALKREASLLQNELLRQEVEGNIPLQQKDINQTILNAQIKSAQDDEKAGTLTASNLINKFEPLAKNFQGIIDSFARVEASVEDPSASGDLALIFNFMKILDPNSVVRESEFATAQNSPGVSDRVRALYNRVLDGQRFTKSVREDFRGRAEKLFKSKERQFRRTESEFRNLARRNRIDPNKVFRTIEFVPSKTKPFQSGEKGKLSTGMKFTIGD